MTDSYGMMLTVSLKCRQVPLCSTVGGPFSRRTGNYTMTSRLYGMCVEWARNRPFGWPLLHRTRHRNVRRRRAKFVKHLSELFLHTSVPIRDQKKQKVRDKKKSGSYCRFLCPFPIAPPPSHTPKVQGCSMSMPAVDCCRFFQDQSIQG